MEEIWIRLFVVFYRCGYQKITDFNFLENKIILKPQLDIYSKSTVKEWVFTNSTFTRNFTVQ